MARSVLAKPISGWPFGWPFKRGVEGWLSPEPRLGIARGVVLFTTLLVAQRLLSDSQFVLLAQMLAICLTIGAVATGSERGRAVAGALATVDDGPMATEDRRTDTHKVVTLVGVLGSIALVLSLTTLAYNSRPDDMVAAVFFVTALYRLPYQLVQSFAPRIARAIVVRNWFSLPALWIIPAGLIAALFAAGFAALVSPWVFEGLAGDGELLERATYSAIAATTTISAINLVGALALAGQARFSLIVAVWVVPGLIVAYPIIRAIEADPLITAIEFYAAIVYLGQMWLWSRTRAQPARANA